MALTMDDFIGVFERCIAASRVREDDDAITEITYSGNLTDVMNHVLALQYDARCGLDDATHAAYVKTMGEVFDVGEFLAIVLLADIFSPGDIFDLDFNAARFTEFWKRVRPTIPEVVILEAREQSEATDIIPNLFMAEQGTRYDKVGNLLVPPKPAESRRRRSFTELVKKFASKI